MVTAKRKSQALAQQHLQLDQIWRGTVFETPPYFREYCVMA
jgi:hypothetical protein